MRTMILVVIVCGVGCASAEHASMTRRTPLVATNEYGEARKNRVLIAREELMQTVCDVRHRWCNVEGRRNVPRGRVFTGGLVHVRVMGNDVQLPADAAQAVYDAQRRYASALRELGDSEIVCRRAATTIPFREFPQTGDCIDLMYGVRCWWGSEQLYPVIMAAGPGSDQRHNY